MKAEWSTEKCLSFINYQLQTSRNASIPDDSAQRLAITISRQAGCGAHDVAEKLAERLPERGAGKPGPWAVYDHNLVNQVLKEHNLPERLVKYMPEDRVSQLKDTIDEAFGLHPSTWVLIAHVIETVLKLAEPGNVILIGRGANIITAKMPHAFHVRLVASLEKRVESIRRDKNLTAKEALKLIQTQDAGRGRFLKTHFHKDIDDPLLYHLVINTGSISYDTAANLICDAALSLQARRAAMAT